MTKKDSPLIQLIGGIILGVYFWPQFKESMLENFFCASFLQNEYSESMFLGLGSCNFMWIFFYILMPLFTILSFLPWILKIYHWIRVFKDNNS